jgi:hypothetical protein
MYNQSNSNTYTVNIPPAQPNISVESLATRASNLLVELADLNNRLADLRQRIFGESEPAANGEKGLNPPLQACIEIAQQQAAAASAQVSSILNRL